MKAKHFCFENKLLKKPAKRHFFPQKIVFFSEYLETEKNSGKTVLIKQPLIFYARQIRFYELGTEIRGF